MLKHRSIFHNETIISTLTWAGVGCLLLFVSNCAGPHRSVSEPEYNKNSNDLSEVKIDPHIATALESDLIALGPSSDSTEARILAKTALQASAHLAQAYRLVRPPHLHNLMVQMGLRNRGLCYHWTADLMYYLAKLRLHSFELRWGVAYRGSDLREHNTVVVTANGQSFHEGLVMDPWRDSGRLYWVVVQNDSYPWHELPREEW
jgi:hypothetical protein